MMSSMRLGIDVGSTTVKLLILDEQKEQILYTRYERHNAKQVKTACALIQDARKLFPEETFRIAVCGSGGRPVAEKLGVHYIQEVVANAAAVRKLYPQTRTAIELGGQDAKIIFFHYDEATGQLYTSDMRMNGSCAGGTGAFVDEVATLLGIPSEEFEALASKGTTLHDISGRCGVFAKTDIQPLLIQGASREDIALSTFHAIAKQTIGGLSQGLELKAPIIFEGGPLTFNPTLIKVFAERLNLSKDQIIIPEHPETIVARGTAIAVDELYPIPETTEELTAFEISSQSKALSSNYGDISLEAHTDSPDIMTLSEAAQLLSDHSQIETFVPQAKASPYFDTKESQFEFCTRHDRELKKPLGIPTDSELNVYLGIDSGSTTSKLVLINEAEDVITTFYSNNYGDPLKVVKEGLCAIADECARKHTTLNILGLGTTGYGELLFARAFGADYHTVETVAHTQGCQKFVPDVTFLLDIGGQDMKAIWLNNGIVTNITLNEACSSGCGSFLENFGSTLGIEAPDIAEKAFSSKEPASLGSRCTVFMNSTIINEQKNGKQTNDIMAGLCRSIIANVFTKVVRISNVEELGDKVVVQGGTFRNYAVLRAIEEYLGKEVTLAPFPGEMGALGAAIRTRRYLKEHGYTNGRSTSFIGMDAVRNFTYTKEDGVSCQICANHCSRTIMKFSTGAQWVTGNRCERGEILIENISTVADSGVTSDENPSHTIDFKNNPELAKKIQKITDQNNSVPDMFKIREKLLFQDYDFTPVADTKHLTIGIPRVLEFWDSAPFWTTFFHALGFQTKLSHPSSRKMYEHGLQFVASDTICFPAKLVHGHIADLAAQKVDKIFMPYMMHMPSENNNKYSTYVCPVIMGYPMVVRNFESPEERFGIPFESPIFHWFSDHDRKKQIIAYATDHLDVTKAQAIAAFQQAAAVIDGFRKELVRLGTQIMQEAKEKNQFAIVLAGRPYHTDPFVCHNISHMFVKRGIPVLTVDSLPELHDVNLRYTRAEVTNDFHTRMLAGASLAASTPELEYVQIVSFGCGHDAILSDEIIRIMNEIGQKPPLVLKMDESDATGSLNIRVQSFVETVRIRRSVVGNSTPVSLPDPYTVKFTKKDKKIKTILVPNVSAAFSKVIKAILEKEGFIAKAVPMGSIEEIQLGKKYVNNDICFPCQMVIGEALSELNKGNYKQDEVAVGMVKWQCDCRMSQYSALLRKALDSAGYKDVAIISTDMNDTKELQPGVSILNAASLLQVAWSVMMIDILESLRRKIRPYELHHGETDRIFEEVLDDICTGETSGLAKAIGAFKRGIDRFCAIEYDRSVLKSKVFVTGEFLVTLHPGSNFDIENYLEKNGMETVFPRITDMFRKDFICTGREITEFKVKIPPYPFFANPLFNVAQNSMEKIALKHPLYEKAASPQQLVDGVSHMIPPTLSCGEGWLIPAEIVHYAKQGVQSFVILQPFGCLPNHICGRGTTKRIKDDFPGVQILPLDLDPDTSFANVENRLQMLIMNEKSKER